VKYVFVSLFLMSCAWDSDKGWHYETAPEEKPQSKQEKPFYKCEGENPFGAFTKGGGCNEFGCWIEGGSCNQFGCSVSGTCQLRGCPKSIHSIKCVP
jgi:hypothetical protein